MNWRRAARGIGEFFLFLILYTVIGAVIGAIALVTLDNLLVKMLLDFFTGSKTAYALFLDVLSAIFAGSFGVLLAVAAQNAILKKPPSRGIGLAFVVWLFANYALHFIYFPEMTDDVVYHGIVQSTVACVVAWWKFRLPPSARLAEYDEARMA
jgi:hypothetical protein